MKNVDTLICCKSCRKPLDGSVEIQASGPPVTPKKNAIGPSGAAGGTVQAGPQDAAAGQNRDSGDFSDLIHADMTEGGADSSVLEQVEVVRETGEDAEPSETSTPAGYKTGTTHVNVKLIDDKERKELLSRNFRQNIIPRLLQILAAIILLAAIAAGAVVYNIMDLPQYYNYFHMRTETTKSFTETLDHLRVAENARAASMAPKGKNSALQAQMENQLEDITFSYKNKYFTWTVYAESFETVPGRKNICMLAAKTKAADKNPNFIRLEFNNDMMKRVPREGMSKFNKRSVIVKGRIIGWKRSIDGTSIEINAYDAEIE